MAKLMMPLVIIFAMLFAYPDGWSDDILINEDTSGYQCDPDISTDTQNNVWVTWDEAQFFDGEIYYSKRDSLGICLIPETNISNNTSNSGLPRVAVDKSDNIHFVWRDESPQGIGIWYAKLANTGSTIVPSHLAVSGAGDILCSLEPEIALNKYQEVNVAWDERPSENQMDYSKLDSLGDTLIAKIQVTPNYMSACWVGIGVDSFANNHLACRTDSGGISNRLTYSKLDKNGNFLIYNKVLATGGNNAIVSDKHQNIHMVYTCHTTYRNDIDYLKLDNNGDILIGPKTISLPQIGSNTYSHMAIDSLQYLHIVWQADSNSNVHIMYAKLDTMGDFIIPPIKIVYPYQGIMPRIAVDRCNRLHVVWVDGRLDPGGDIFYKRGENNTSVKETAQSKAVNLPRLSVCPNPFNKETKIAFFVSQETKKAKLEIYDIVGRKVKEFMVEGSDGVIQWNGADSNGKPLPAGVYFLRVSSAEIMKTNAIVRLK